MNGRSTLFALVALCTFVGACDSKSNGSAGAAPTSSAQPITFGADAADGGAAAGAGSAAVLTKAGAWTGTYISKQAPEPAPRKAEDDGTQGVGDGAVTLSLDDKTVRGTLDGALGESVLTGTSSGDTMSGTLYPKQAAPTSFYGTWVLEKKDGALKGKIVASRGNAGAVREAELVLKGK